MALTDEDLRAILRLEPDSGVARIALEALSTVSGIPKRDDAPTTSVKFRAVKNKHVKAQGRKGTGLSKLRQALEQGALIHQETWSAFVGSEHSFRTYINLLRKEFHPRRIIRYGPQGQSSYRLEK